MNHPLRDAQVTARWMSRWTPRTVWLIRTGRLGAYMAATQPANTEKGEYALERYEGGRRVWDCTQRARTMVATGIMPAMVIEGVERAIGVTGDE